MKHPRHGQDQTPLHKVWIQMRQRCNNPRDRNFATYGGRGVQVCGEWGSFKPFFEWASQNGYMQGLQIDRIDPDGNYEPDNCRFVTSLENNRNRRNTPKVEYNGETISLAEAAERSGINYHTLYHRLRKNGQTVDFFRSVR